MLIFSDSRSGLSARKIVFVVDDQPLIADTIALILNRVGEEFIAISCHSAAEAIITAEGIKPDLVLLDVRMPGVEGLEHAIALRDGLGCQVLLMSGAMETGSLLETIAAAGARPFSVVPKPIAPPELIKEIRGALTDVAIANIRPSFAGPLAFNAQFPSLEN